MTTGVPSSADADWVIGSTACRVQNRHRFVSQTVSRAGPRRSLGRDRKADGATTTTTAVAMGAAHPPGVTDELREPLCADPVEPHNEELDTVAGRRRVEDLGHLPSSATPPERRHRVAIC